MSWLMVLSCVLLLLGGQFCWLALSLSFLGVVKSVVDVLGRYRFKVYIL